jgi:hypothetical protein
MYEFLIKSSAETHLRVACRLVLPLDARLVVRFVRFLAELVM